MVLALKYPSSAILIEPLGILNTPFGPRREVFIVAMGRNRTLSCLGFFIYMYIYIYICIYIYVCIYILVCIYIYIGPHAIHGPQYNHPNCQPFVYCDGWHLEPSETWRLRWRLAGHHDDVVDLAWAQNSQFFASSSKARARRRVFWGWL